MTTATESVSGWLSDFQVALDRGDIDGAAAMFAEESYWRDLVSFTWNIKTLEGRQEIADMLRSQLEHVQPSGFALVGEGTWQLEGDPDRGPSQPSTEPTAHGVLLRNFRARRGYQAIHGACLDEYWVRDGNGDDGQVCPRTSHMAYLIVVA